MDKHVLQDYVDACAIVKDTEIAICKLEKRKAITQDSVKGSNPNFPYQAQHFSIQGTAFRVTDDSKLRHEEDVLFGQQNRAKELKEQVEQWMITVPMRMQRIIRYRIINGCTWEETARNMGRRATTDSIRMEFNNFFEK